MIYIFNMIWREEKYSIDAIIDSIGKIDNKVRICDFFDNVTLKRPDAIKLIIFTIEGEPIFRTIIYNGNFIKLIDDSTKTSLKSYNEYTGNRYLKKAQGEMIAYNLYQDEEFIRKMFSYRS